MSNVHRTRDGLPMNFIDGLKVKGVDIKNLFADPGGSAMIAYETGLTVQSVLDTSVVLTDYTALRAYSGRATMIRITNDGIAGLFKLDGVTTTTTEDNGGTVICAAAIGAKRWKRVFDGTVSVRWFGASPASTPSDNYAACQAALNSGARLVVVPADGNYTINAELIVPAGVVLEGQTGARIIQDTYGLSGVQLRNAGGAVKKLTIENLKTKTLLSTTVPNRYGGDVQRTRASGIYVAASNCTIENVACPGFINGVNLVGGERVWATTSGTLTSTTLQLNATSQQENDYYNGWTLRIFSTVAATDYVIVTDYDSASNTVTFPTVSTFSGPYYYILIGGKHTGNTVRGYKGDRNDFGILAQYQDALTVDDIDQLSIEQTQEINARPHTVYITDQVTNLRGGRWRTNNCPEGHAYKFRAVTGAVLTDLSARNSRAVLAIEESSRFYVDGCIGIDIGVVGFRPESLNIVSSQDVCVNNVKLRISNTFDTPEDAALRPVAVAIGAGTFAANNRVTIRNVDTSCRGANISHGVLITAPSSGSHTNINVDGVLLAGNGTYSGGATQPNFVRAFGVDGLTVGQLKHVGTDTPTVMLEATAINSVVSYGSAYAAPTITDAGASNRIIVDGVESGVWAPLLIGSMVVGTNTYVVNVGEYQKTGRVVTLRFRIELSSFNSTGNIRVTGLPFPVSQIVGGVNMDPGTIFSRYSGITLAAGALPGINAIAGQNRLDLGVYSNAGVVPIEHTDIAATAAMQGTITYITV